jgi:hypothetical protein
MTEPLDDLTLGRDQWCKRLVAFFWTSCSSVMHPTRCSYAAIRIESWPWGGSGRLNTEAARLREMAFQLVNP